MTLTKRCPKHPTYTGKNKPRKCRDGEICADCQTLYENVHWRDFKCGECFGAGVKTETWMHCDPGPNKTIDRPCPNCGGTGTVEGVAIVKRIAELKESVPQCFLNGWEYQQSSPECATAHNEMIELQSKLPTPLRLEWIGRRYISDGLGIDTTRPSRARRRSDVHLVTVHFAEKPKWWDE